MNSIILRSTLFGICASAMLAQSQVPAQPQAPAQDGGWRRFEDAAPAQQGSGPAQVPAPGQYSNAPAPSYAPLPAHLTLPAGTLLTIHVDEPLSTEHNKTGDGFTATLVRPVIAQGFVVARPGQGLDGRITQAVRAGRVEGTSKLAFELSDLNLVDGQRVPVKTQLAQYSGGTTVGNDVAAVGTTTGVGAAIGAAAGGGVGAGIGAGAGLVASLAGVLITRGRPTVILPDGALTFHTLEPITIATDAAPQSFQPAQPQDYDTRPVLRRPPGPPPVGYYGGPAPYPYPSPYYGYAYGPYYGPGYYGPGVVVYGRYGRRW
jgi:hypothetical protein